MKKLNEANYILAVCTALYFVLAPIAWLKKHYSVLLFAMMPFAGFSQVFIGMDAGNKGVGLNAGGLVDQIEIKAGINSSLYRSETPFMVYGSIGYQIPITGYEEDNISITPSIGFAHLSYQDFSKYETEDRIIRISHFKPKYSLEIGKDKNIGRVYVSATYASYTFFSIGFRGYIK